jgi:hypothetical protein
MSGLQACGVSALPGGGSRYGTTKTIFVPGRNGLRACPYAVPLSGSVSVHCSAVTGRLRVRRWGGDRTYTDAAASDHESGVGGVNNWPEAA